MHKAGLLTCTLQPVFPFRYPGTVTKEGLRLVVLTAAGTVPDFHRIPF